MKIDAEKIILDLANITADYLLKKDLSKHYELINGNLRVLNNFIDDYLENESEGYKMFTGLAYQYYRMKDLALPV